MRAAESERPDRLLDDPLAKALAGEQGMRMLGPDRPHLADVGAYIAIRTRFFDDFAMRVASDGTRQVVILAAGMDARAFRLDWPEGTTLFELDRPELLAVKEEILQNEHATPRCKRVVVPADLAEPWTEKLTGAGFAADVPSLWVAEGLFFYLEEALVEQIIAQLSALAAPGSSVAADFVSNSFLTSPWMKPALDGMEARGMGWRSSIDEPETLFASWGWDARVTLPGQEGAGVGRWPYPVMPREMKEVPHSLMLTAARRTY